uniref:Secreted protein n=1 Tax=Junco hyemalis TaxID=40217 RepID=A0A8C5IRT6_JUNHY
RQKILDETSFACLFLLLPSFQARCGSSLGAEALVLTLKPAALHCPGSLGLQAALWVTVTSTRAALETSALKKRYLYCLSHKDKVVLCAPELLVNKVTFSSASA